MGGNDAHLCGWLHFYILPSPGKIKGKQKNKFHKIIVQDRPVDPQHL